MDALPEDPLLAECARHVAEAGWSAAIFDSQYYLRWVSGQCRQFLGVDEDVDLGTGRHIADAFFQPVWLRTVHPDSQVEMFDQLAPYVASELRDERALREALPEQFVPMLDDLPEPPPQRAVTSASFLYLNPREDRGLPDYRVHWLFIRLHREDGSVAGWLTLFAIGGNQYLMSLLARGDQAMYERMARLTDPGHRQAAILFCDLAGSGALSKQLPSAEYFSLIRRLWTGIDAAFADNCGIVGKHAGDGASGFFLVDDAGGPSEAAAAAITTARRITTIAAETFADVAGASEAMKVAVHWGSSLYMGQLVPGGRLEVTALGDEVNEAARIEQATAPGQITASKQLLEHLTAEDAARLGIDVTGLRYETLAALARDDNKVVRDAGSLAVTVLPLQRAREDSNPRPNG